MRFAKSPVDYWVLGGRVGAGLVLARLYVTRSALGVDLRALAVADPVAEGSVFSHWIFACFIARYFVASLYPVRSFSAS